MRELETLNIIRKAMKNQGYLDDEVQAVLTNASEEILDQRELLEHSTLQHRQWKRRQMVLESFKPQRFQDQRVEFVPLNGRPVADDGSFNPAEFEVGP